MTGFLASLTFLLAASVALAAIAGTVLRYRGSVLANFAAHRDLAGTRDVYFRVVEFGRQPALVNSTKVRRIGQRAATVRQAMPEGWRAAA